MPPRKLIILGMLPIILELMSNPMYLTGLSRKMKRNSEMKKTKEIINKYLNAIKFRNKTNRYFISMEEHATHMLKKD